MSRRGRRVGRYAAVVVSASLVAGCGSAEPAGGDTTLTWAVGPDLVDAEALARTCTDQAGGAYRIVVEQLPTDVTARHDLLVRRGAARDDSVDVLSLDTSMTPELAAAGYLAAVPPDLASAVSADVAPAAVAAATHDGRLVAAPWFLDPQVLWSRGNLAERAGLDTSGPISWDDLVAGAERLGVTVQVHDPDGSGLAAWVDALVAGSGGELVAGSGRDAEVGLAGEPGRTAASIVEFFEQAEVGPGPSADALTAFASSNGGFLIASAAAIADPDLASVSGEMVATAYPSVGAESIAPLAGVALAVPRHATDRDASFAAIECLTAPDQLRTLMTDGPQDELVREAVESGSAVPVTPYWFQVVRALDETWRPIGDVSPDSTPAASQAAVEAAVEGTLR